MINEPHEHQNLSRHAQLEVDRRVASAPLATFALGRKPLATASRLVWKNMTAVIIFESKCKVHQLSTLLESDAHSWGCRQCTSTCEGDMPRVEQGGCQS